MLILDSSTPYSLLLTNTEDRRQGDRETGDRRQEETEDRRQETGDRRQETETGDGRRGQETGETETGGAGELSPAPHLPCSLFGHFLKGSEPSGLGFSH